MHYVQPGTSEPISLSRGKSLLVLRFEAAAGSLLYPKGIEAYEKLAIKKIAPRFTEQ
jgi:hypothetical protein